MKAKDTCHTSASAICTRLVHVLVTVGITTALFVKCTVLRNNLENGYYFYPIVYLIFVISSIIMYFVVACMDPGYVKRGQPDVKEIQLVVDEENDDIDDIALYEVEKGTFDKWDIELNKHEHGEKTKMLGNELGNRSRAKCFNLEPHERCGLCGLQRPLRAKHCRDCKRCVRKFDHHCPWITNCVGERNHRWFYIFLVVNLTLLAWSIHISTTGYSSPGASQHWVSENLILVLVDVVMGILIVIVAILFCIHTYLIINNNTTWETMSRNRITYLKEIKDSVNPFNLGPCRNVFVFFCNFHPYDWTIVYSKSQNSSRTTLFDSGVDVEEFCEITVDES